MLLLLMRHGLAQPLDADSTDDFGRPLTKEGRVRTRRAALGLRQIVPQLDFLASSPKSRARATAQIVSDIFARRAPAVTEWAELMEDDSSKIIRKISGLKAQTVLLCGHEPYLSELALQLLSGSSSGIEFKKASVMTLEVDFSSGEAILLWHLRESQLRQIGR